MLILKTIIGQEHVTVNVFDHFLKPMEICVIFFQSLKLS